MSRYKIIQSLAWLLALVMLAVVLSRLPISSILNTISGLSITLWLVWAMLNMIIIALYGLRWFILIQPLKLSVSYVQLLLIRQAGQAISFITPGPQFGGEPLQVFWLWRNFYSPGSSALLAVALDRFYELWINFAVLLFGIVLLLGTPSQDFADWKSIGAVLSFLILILSFLGWILLRQRTRVSDWIKKLASRWERGAYLNDLDTHWNSLSRQLEEVVVKNKKTLVYALIISMVGWAGMLIEIGFLLSFLDIRMSFSDFVYLMVAMRLAFLLPLPGGIGTLEAAVFWVFLSLELPATAAIGLIALMRLRDAMILIASLASVRVLQMKFKTS
jgi:glycosyltransferase 2 family protein